MNELKDVDLEYGNLYIKHPYFGGELKDSGESPCISEKGICDLSEVFGKEKSYNHSAISRETARNNMKFNRILTIPYINDIHEEIKEAAEQGQFYKFYAIQLEKDDFESLSSLLKDLKEWGYVVECKLRSRLNEVWADVLISWM